MAHEGMVHALKIIHRLLKTDGLLVDIHPIAEGYLIKAIQGETILFSEPKRETCSEDVIQAEKAISQVIEQGLFALDQRSEFDFLTYGSSVPELRAYLEEQSSFETDPLDDALDERVEGLYAQIEAIMQTSPADTQVAIHERAIMSLLRPMRV